MISLSNPPTLSAKIDWYSFTLAMAGPLEGSGPDVLQEINRVLSPVFSPAVDPVEGDGTWSLAEAKGFYAFRATHVASRIAVSWGAVNAHVFVELAGQSCDWLRAAGFMRSVVAGTFERVSRIDCAIDLHTTTTPEVFVGAGHAERFKDSLGNIKSSTGHTFYVGSRKSDRCARVYRYAPPHPRSHLLRCEAEFKGKAAKELAVVLNSDGELEAIRAAHRVFQWASPELTMDFLPPVSCAADRLTSPVTASIDGSPTASYPPLCGITQRDWWMLESGWLTWFYRRWKRRLMR